MRVLVPIDGSRHSAEAVDIALDYAKSKAIEIYLLSVTPSIADMDSTLSDSQIEDLSSSLLHGREALLEETRSYLESNGTTAKCVARITSGSVAEEICDFAEKEEIDLVVIGSRGLREFSKFPMGSVATEVVRYSPCSVFVVRIP